MTMTHSLILCVLAACLFLPTSIVAWGFESRNTRRSASLVRLQGRETDLDTDMTVELYRFKLNSLFDSQYGDDFAFVRERAEELASETFSQDSSFDACGEDCEECEIPAEWKNSFGSDVNVMEFLGIKRAQPLRANGSDQYQ